MKHTFDSLLCFARVLASAISRFYWNDGFSRAAGLAYTSLFALVPITALSFSMFHYFGFDGREVLETVVAQVLPPADNAQVDAFRNEIVTNLQGFSENVGELTKKLNVVSIAILIISSIALLNAIESALNVVWRVGSERSVVAKVTSFWAVLTLGPILIAVSIYGTAQVVALSQEGGEYISAFVSFAILTLPVLASVFALSLLYFIMPSTRVRFRDALCGGIVAGVLFEIVKQAFAYYVGASSTYSTLYGVIAVIPLFLFWLYIAWVVVILGAEVAYLSGSIHVLQGIKKYATELGEAGPLLGLRMLLIIGKRFVEGKNAPNESELAIETGANPVLVRSSLDLLTKAQIIAESDSKSHAYSLIIATEKLTLERIFDAFLSQKREKENQSIHNEAYSFINQLTTLAQGSKKPEGLAQKTLSDLI